MGISQRLFREGGQGIDVVFEPAGDRRGEPEPAAAPPDSAGAAGEPVTEVPVDAALPAWRWEVPGVRPALTPSGRR
ncbi:hypothetical protein ACFO4E_23120 [Nocardiopsis mangrovi]|uniref:Uncharacterized protein n=1 Tax=Nocardiopsis mangrovi TaxID=1179818 RepID=A0ABV9E0Y5_9ACTN